MKPFDPPLRAFNRVRRAVYKAAGCKLVVVEFELDDGLIRGLQVAGDFFLYPDDALARLRAAIEGTRADLSVRERTALLEAALHADDRLVGLTCATVAVAVHRALVESP